MLAEEALAAWRAAQDEWLADQAKARRETFHELLDEADTALARLIGQSEASKVTLRAEDGIVRAIVAGLPVEYDGAWRPSPRIRSCPRCGARPEGEPLETLADLGHALSLYETEQGPWRHECRPDPAYGVTTVPAVADKLVAELDRMDRTRYALAAVVPAEDGQVLVVGVKRTRR